MDLRRASRLRRAGSADRRQHVESHFTFSAASLASDRVSATTTATGSPTWHAFTCASAGCGAIFMGEPSLEWINQPQMRLPILSAESSVR